MIATLRYRITQDMLQRRSAAPWSRASGGGDIAALDVMEQHLSRHRYFVGERYSVADIALYAYTHVAAQGGLISPGYVAIRR